MFSKSFPKKIKKTLATSNDFGRKLKKSRSFGFVRFCIGIANIFCKKKKIDQVFNKFNIKIRFYLTFQSAFQLDSLYHDMLYITQYFIAQLRMQRPRLQLALINPS